MRSPIITPPAFPSTLEPTERRAPLVFSSVKIKYSMLVSSSILVVLKLMEILDSEADERES